MNDIDLLRNQPEHCRQQLMRRGYELDADQFKMLDLQRKKHLLDLERLQAEKNALAATIAHAKKNGQDSLNLEMTGSQVRHRIEELCIVADASEKAFTDFLQAIPNIPALDTPDGNDASANRVLRQMGEPKNFDFTPKPHDELGQIHAGLDFEAGARLSGARFTVLKGHIARLHRALIQYMLDTQVDQNGYTEIQTPYLVKADALFGTGQLPKFEEDLFRLERDGLYLIPTAEVPVTNLVANQTLLASDLPLAFACHTPCFRREAGSAGRDMKGMIRQHQFEKVELVRICSPSAAEEEFSALLSHAESILLALELPYRVVNLCAGDLGFSSKRTFDLEVWMPGQNAWREISSVSWFGDFQARRMRARMKDEAGKKQFLHTLNGSGLAAGRALVAVLETYQQPDGSIRVPDVLRDYMGGLKTLLPAHLSESQ